MADRLKIGGAGKAFGSPRRNGLEHDLGKFWRQVLQAAHARVVFLIRLSPDYSRGALHARDEIRMLIDRLHRQGIQVIAQQLEDPQEAALLWMSGIDFIQGNLVQAPQAALDFDFSHAVL